jgi:uridylate kinase
LKATKVDGVYSADPKIDKTAKKFTRLNFMDSIRKRLGVMDMTALTLCMENRMPIAVFNMAVKGNIERAALGQQVGTLIS